jgi:hypothetical protein
MTEKAPLDTNKSCNLCRHKQVCHFQESAIKFFATDIPDHIMPRRIEVYSLRSCVRILLANFCREYMAAEYPWNEENA